MHAPSQLHLTHLKSILRYLKGIVNHGLLNKASFSISQPLLMLTGKATWMIEHQLHATFYFSVTIMFPGSQLSRKE